ncbi:MAG TPA: hypothetical protein DDZ81_20410 [Acetobacteraceae bacterium]|jgi:hypothetical protein|nr:hypothetical protein [Acetobacteraceae bacterium]
MNAVVKLTGYEKTTELLTTIATVPSGLVSFAKTIAGVPETDPGVAAMYPLTVPQAEALAAEASLALDPDRFDYCLEAIAEDGRSQAWKV